MSWKAAERKMLLSTAFVISCIIAPITFRMMKLTAATAPNYSVP